MNNIIHYHATEPISPKDGDSYMDTTTGTLKIYNSGTWRSYPGLVNINTKYNIGDRFHIDDIYYNPYFEIIAIDNDIYLINEFSETGEWLATVERHYSDLNEIIDMFNVKKIDHFPWHEVKDPNGCSEPKKCTCSSYDLFNFGCKCGGI